MLNSKNQIKNIIEKCEEVNQTLKSQTCCFTGHRSQKLPWKFNENDIRCKETIEKITEEIEKAIHIGYKYFISGMALGFDIMCAEAILNLKPKYPYIKLICALPCKNQYKYWNIQQKTRYKQILRKADIIRYISKDYTNDCLKERNIYMLMNSSLVIALFNGQNGGTKNTISEAKKLGLKTVILAP